MIINELLKEDPQVNDAIDLEFGDLLIETTITDITEDGIVVALDEAAIKLILAAKKQIISESYSGVDVRTTIINPDFDDQDESSPEEMVVGVDFNVHGKYYPATSEEPAEYPEIEVKKIINYETGEDITHKVDEDTIDHLIDLAHKKYGPLSSRGGVAEGAPELLQKEMPLHRHAEKLLAQNGVSKDDTDYHHHLANTIKHLRKFGNMDQINKQGVAEAEYQGRKVPLGKPFLTPDGPKKRSVYVKNPKGNVVKVNFGQKGVKIKKNNPARRKSFRARHNCKNPGPRHKARFWSCKFW